MTATTSDHVDYKENSLDPDFYANYVSARKNGKHAITFFWGFLRHQLERGLLDSYLEDAYRKLNQRAIRDGTGSTASPGESMRVTFSFGGPDIKARCVGIAASYRLSMADTVRVILAASQLHETHTAGSPATTSTVSCPNSARPALPMVVTQVLTPTTPSTMVDASTALEPSLPKSPHDAPRTKFCKETMKWKMFKPMRPNATMTTERLKDISAMGGAYEVMDAAELALYGLSNPVAESNDGLQAAVTETGSAGANVIEIHSKPHTPPATTSRQAQDAIAQMIFAAADRMLENAA